MTGKYKTNFPETEADYFRGEGGIFIIHDSGKKNV